MSDFDWNAIVWHDCPNISAYAQTARILSIDITGGSDAFRIRFDKDSVWPRSTPQGWEGGVQFTLGMVMMRNGQWHGSAVIECWDPPDRGWGGPMNNIGVGWFYADNPGASRWGPMSQPRAGEQIGMFVNQGSTRGKEAVTFKERSDMVLFAWPSGPARVYEAGAAPAPSTPDPVVSAPPPASGDLAEVKATLDAHEARLGQIQAQLQNVAHKGDSISVLNGRLKGKID